MFTIYGGKTEFTQWDQGQRVTNPKMVVGDKAVFRNASGETHPMIAYLHEGVVVADVPNDFLMTALPILVDLCETAECRTRFLVIAKDKPEGYVEIDNTPCLPKESSGGVSSWNDLTDKPFGKATVPSDTLTWDGNTDGLVSVADVLYKVSDAELTAEDVADASATFSNGEVFTGVNMIADGVTLLSEGVIFVTADGVGFDLDGMTFTEPGIYFAHYGAEGHIASLTIPGYTGFTKTEVKRIDPEYLPEGYPYKTEETILDGTFEFSDPGNGKYMHQITGENIALVEGKSYTVMWDGEAYPCVAISVGSIGGTSMVALGNLGLIGQADTGEPFMISVNAAAGVAGIVAQDTAATHTVKVCTETIHTMAPEFLPAGVGGGGMVVTVTGESNSFTSDKTFAEIAEAVKANMGATLCWVQEGVGKTYYSLRMFWDEQGVIFSGVNDIEGEVSVETFTIMSDNSIGYTCTYLTVTQ